MEEEVKRREPTQALVRSKHRRSRETFEGYRLGNERGCVGVDGIFQTTSPVATSGAHGACLRVCVRDSERFSYPFLANSVWSSVRKLFLVFETKASSIELSPAVTKQIWLGIAILFLLIYTSPGQLKKLSEVNIFKIPGKRGPWM